MKPLSKNFIFLTILVAVASFWILSSASQNKDKVEKSLNSPIDKTQPISEGAALLTSDISEEKAAKKKEKRETFNLSGEQKRYLSGPKYLRRYLALNTYVLKSAEQKQQIWDELTSLERQNQALKNLTDIRDKSDSTLERDRRLAIFYLVQAVSLSDNPNREHLMDQMAQYLVDVRNTAKMEPIAKRAYAGDQIEIFKSLHKVNPILTASIMEEVKGTKKYSLFKYALRKDKI